MDLASISEMTETQAREHFEKLRWPNGPTCHHCGCCEVVRLNCKSARPGLLRCKGCRKQFTVTVGTIFEDSHIPLRKWLIAIHLMCSSKKGISALQLKRNLGLKSYKSAWHLAHRIRFAMDQEPLRGLLCGTVEVDETYVGGYHKGGKRGTGSENKTPVVVLVERNGAAMSRVVPKVTSKNLKQTIRELVHYRSTIMTDDLRAYRGIGPEFHGGHFAVRHSIGEYVRGEAHTNTAECYFALLKRGIVGAFHHVSRKHLPLYCKEFDFRWNMRKRTDYDRVVQFVKQSRGKRLMYQTPVKGPE